ncbi:MAG: Flp pilus assembly protein CpaB [Proteobacteria bacterium]|nr:Flp pilus assembly protein CpaB [Pseudomonadota bacterium]
MSPRQIIVLVVAAIAAIGALLVIRGMGAHRDAAATPTAPPIAGQQVLVAAHDVQQGAALAPGDLAVALFPTSSLSPTFIRIDQNPSAQTQFVGAVTRRAFVQGEPITVSSVVQPDGHGFMAAVLQPGLRAVAVEVARKDSAGGYIQPNDHVDVIVTSRQNNEAGGGQQVHSDIVLQDVRVLAMGDATQTPAAGDHPTSSDANIAVLELSPEDARALALADGMGDISLALRGVQAETVGLHTSHSGGSLTQSSGGVKIHAFGTVTGGGR